MSSDDDLRRVLGEDAAGTADPDEVWAAVQHGVQRRRRRRERVGAGLVLTAVAGLGVSLGAYLAAPQDVGPPAGTTATASPSPESTPPPDDAPAPSTPPLTAAVILTPAEARGAFADAGYTEDDARRLQTLWQWGDVDDVTVLAGADLLAGAPLPLEPGQVADVGAEGGRTGLYEELAAFGEAGYTEADAAALAEEWGEDPQTVRVLVGHLLLEGRLPAGG